MVAMEREEEDAVDGGVLSLGRKDDEALEWFVAADDYIRYRLEKENYCWEQAPGRSAEFDTFCNAVRLLAEEAETKGNDRLGPLTSRISMSYPSSWHKDHLVIGEKLFADEISWGQISALYGLGGMLAVRVLKEELNTDLLDLTSFWIGECIEKFALKWIRNNGGSPAFVNYAQKMSDFKDSETEEVRSDPVGETSTNGTGTVRFDEAAKPRFGLDEINGNEILELIHEIPLQQNQLRIGDYEFAEDSKLGEGKFGVVYRGCHVENRNAVALKKLPNSALQSRELSMIANLDNPSIVKYYGMEKAAEEGFSYIIMELCDMDLSTYLDQHTALKGSNLNLTGHSLASGYFALHQISVVHRDLKPQNLLLKLSPHRSPSGPRRISSRKSSVGAFISSNFRKFSRSISTISSSTVPVVSEDQPDILSVKITDFGCSRQLEKAGDDFSNLAGTFLYMAPEVGANLVEESFYDSTVDMWSIGVVLYECATGKIPYDENALCKLFLKAACSNFAGFKPPLPRRVSGSNGKPEEAVGKLVQIDPDLRISPEDLHNFMCSDEPHTPIRTESSESSLLCLKFRNSGLTNGSTESAAQKNARLRKERMHKNSEQSSGNCCGTQNVAFYCCCGKA